MKFILNIFISLIFFYGFSQSRTNNYIQAKDTIKGFNKRFLFLDSLLLNYKKENKHIEFLKYTNEFVDLSLKYKEYEKAINKVVECYNYLGHQVGKTSSILSLINKVEKYSLKVNDSNLIGRLFTNKGATNYNNNNFKEAINSYNKALTFFGEKDSIFTADVIFFKGQLYLETKNYLKAMKNFNLAIKYYEKLKDLEYIFLVRQCIINLNSSCGFYKKAISDSEKLIEEKIKFKKTDGLFFNFYYLANSYKKILNNNKQEEYLLKALDQTTSNTADHLKIGLYASLTKFYATKNTVKATNYFKKSQEYIVNIDENHFIKNSFCLSEAFLLFGTNKLQKAKKKLKYLLKKKNLSPEIQLEAEHLLSLVFKKLNNPKQELHYYKIYTKRKDSLNSLEKVNAVNYIFALFESERNKKIIANNNSKIKLLELDKKHKSKIILFGIIGACLSILIIILVFKRNILRKKKGLREKYAQNLILFQEQERKRISKDLHDSLGQTLLLINNEITNCSSQKIKELLDIAIEEVRTISRSLRPLQFNQTSINNALENLIEQLDNSYKKIYFFSDLDNIEGVLKEENQTHLFRIVQECLSNVIKHSQADSTRVTLINKKHYLYLYIKDNGIGFHFKNKYSLSNGLGLKNIKERVNFLNASLKIDSFTNEGTSITIKIPKN
jgi:signal transduction histidine kinase